DRRPADSGGDLLRLRRDAPLRSGAHRLYERQYLRRVRHRLPLLGLAPEASDESVLAARLAVVSASVPSSRQHPRADRPALEEYRASDLHRAAKPSAVGGALPALLGLYRRGAGHVPAGVRMGAFRSRSAESGGVSGVSVRHTRRHVPGDLAHRLDHLPCAGLLRHRRHPRPSAGFSAAHVRSRRADRAAVPDGLSAADPAADHLRDRADADCEQPVDARPLLQLYRDPARLLSHRDAALSAVRQVFPYLPETGAAWGTVL